MRVSRYLIGSGQQAPVSFRSSFPASEVLTESLLDTPTDDPGFSDPSDLPEAQHWWDASDETTITDTGGDVTAWADKIGALVFNNAGTTEPVTGNAANDINGLNTIKTLGGVNGGLDEADFPVDTAFAVYMMISIDGVDNSADTIISAGDTSSGLGINVIANNATQFNGRLLSSTGTTTDFTGGPYSGLVLFGLKVDAAANTLIAEINGSVVATMSDYGNNFVNGLRVRLGDAFSSGNGLEARFCEVVWCDSVPADEAALESYLTNKWTPAGGDALLLESGDTLLLESGDRLLLE